MVPVGSGTSSGVDQVAVAEPLPDRPEWLVALLFRVGRGSTDLVAHAVMPRPADWPTEESRSEPSDTFPHPSTLEARRWLAAWANVVPDPGPTDRLTTAVVRSVHTSGLERWARGYIARLQGSLVKAGAAGDPIRKSRGALGSGDGRLALLAARYVELCSDQVTKAPLQVLANEWSLAIETVRSYLYRARERGLLTSPGRGRAGGELTDRAIDLLRGDEDGKR